jgi:tRNA nucleotidyltransferase/poly(A) polymerase
MPPGGILARPDVQAAFALLDADGEEARLVGGAVRNSLIGLPPGDIDIATTALPKVVMKRARKAGLRALPTGVEHGTVTLLFDGTPIEVTTLREDVETDGRRAMVTFGRSFAHDALRRDFTMNALYADRDGRVIDEVGGLPDLAARRVRFIGDPETRIREDYLRILRLFRFHAAYGEGPLDRAALTASIRLRDGLARLSAERIRAELLKLLAARRAAQVVPEIADSGLLGRILPLAPDPQAFARLKAGGETDPMGLLAALAVRIPEDGVLLRARLRLSNAETEHLERLGGLVAALHDKPLDRASLRRLAHRHGSEPVRLAASVVLARRGAGEPEMAAVAAALAEPLPALPFTGAMVVAGGVRPGPRVGQVLGAAQRLWLDAGMPTDGAACQAILAAALAEAGASGPA